MCKVRWRRPEENSASLRERARTGFWYSECFGVYIRCRPTHQGGKKIRRVELSPVGDTNRYRRYRRCEAWLENQALNERIIKAVFSSGHDLATPQCLILWGNGETKPHP